MIDFNKKYYLVDRRYKVDFPTAVGLEIVSADDFNKSGFNKKFILTSFNNELEAKAAQGAILATRESHEYLRGLITEFFKSLKVNDMKIRTAYLYVVLDNDETCSEDRIVFFTEKEGEIEEFKELYEISDENFNLNYRVEEILLSKGLMDRLASVAGGTITWND